MPANQLSAASMAQPQRSRRNTSAGSDMELTSFSAYNSRPMSASSLDPSPKPGSLPATNFSSPTPTGSRRVSNTSMGLHGHGATPADYEDLNSVVTQAGSACHSFSSLHSMLQDLEPHPAGDSPQTTMANPILEDPDQEAHHADAKPAATSAAAAKTGSSSLTAGDAGLPPRASRLSNDSSTSLHSNSSLPAAAAGVPAARNQAGNIVENGSPTPVLGSHISAGPLLNSKGGHGDGPLAVPNAAEAKVPLPAAAVSKGLPPTPPTAAAKEGYIDDPLGAAAVAAGVGQEGEGKAGGISNVRGAQTVAPSTGKQYPSVAKEKNTGDAAVVARVGAEEAGEGNDTQEEAKEGGVEGNGGKGKPLKGAIKGVMSWGSALGQKLQRNGNPEKASPANSQQELSSM